MRTSTSRPRGAQSMHIQRDRGSNSQYYRRNLQEFDLERDERKFAPAENPSKKSRILCSQIPQCPSEAPIHPQYTREQQKNRRAIVGCLSVVSPQRSQRGRVFGRQSTDQKFELGKIAQTGEARIIQEERPTGESSVEAPFKPLKCGFAHSCKGQGARNLIVSMV